MDCKGELKVPNYNTLLIVRRQVLNKQNQWIKATPVEGTIVVNIGDYMMRLCNDLYK